jgi:hypothetical protein
MDIFSPTRKSRMGYTIIEEVLVGRKEDDLMRKSEL